MSSESKNIVEFTLIYNRYKVKIYNYVLKMTNSYDLTEDIVQNVFLKLYESIESINDKDRIGFWLFKSARNDIYKHFRTNKMKREKSSLIEESLLFTEVSDTRELYELKEINNLVIKLLEKVPEEQKETYLLKESGGLSYSEIATITDVEVKTVKSRLYDVRQKLIKQLSKVI